MQNLLTLAQEIYFDLIDAQEEQHLRATKSMPEQFQGVDEWLQEQIDKISQIENAIQEFITKSTEA